MLKGIPFVCIFCFVIGCVSHQKEFSAVGLDFPVMLGGPRSGEKGHFEFSIESNQAGGLGPCSGGRNTNTYLPGHFENHIETVKNAQAPGNRTYLRIGQVEFDAYFFLLAPIGFINKNRLNMKGGWHLAN